MLIVTIVNSLVVVTVVMIHYEFLYRLTVLMPKLKTKYRYRIVLGVYGSLLAHGVEIWVFAIAYFVAQKLEGWGHLQGNFDGSFLDCAYYSVTAFTTLGVGDIEPMGPLRFLTGVESLTGLVLITWSASFLFFKMQRYWFSNR